jgi:N-acetylglucosamine-6-phosphate deacetylase
LSRTLLRARRLVIGDRILDDGALLVSGERIAAVGPAAQIPRQDADAVVEHDGVVVPGFIDLQVNGQMGRDLMEATPEGLAGIRRGLARRGTTAFLATTISARVEDELVPVLLQLQQTLASAPVRGGAEALGIHCEGPFLGEKTRGTHEAARLQEPTPERVALLREAAGAQLRLVTLAPELPGALAAVALLTRAGILVALGHTAATPEVVEQAALAGASLCTHLFNGMAPFSHRAPGPAGAVLAHDQLVACVIPDGVHLDPRVVKLTLKAKGPEQVIAVTDSTAAAGMPDGRYRLGTHWTTVKEGVCRDAEGRLAGSTLTMDVAFRNLVRMTGCDLVTAARLTSGNAARLLRVADRKGTLAVGRDADLVLLDQELRLRATWCRGDRVDV